MVLSMGTQNLGGGGTPQGRSSGAMEKSLRSTHQATSHVSTTAPSSDLQSASSPRRNLGRCNHLYLSPPFYLAPPTSLPDRSASAQTAKRLPDGKPC